MKNLLFLSMIMMLASEAAFADTPQISTTIYSEAKINRFRRKDHPFKLGYCLGRDTDISNEDFQSIFESNQNSGKSSRVENRGDSEIADFYFGVMKWNFEFSPDEVLRFSFSQDTKKAESSTSDSLCNTTLTTSHLLGQKSKASGAILLTVPKNVYVLRIRNTSFETTISRKNLSTSYKVLNRATKTFDNIVMPEFRDAQYLYVRPGDLVSVNMILETDSIEKVDFNVAYEVGFLGSYRCDDILKTDVSKTTASIVSKVLNASTSNQDELDKMLVATSCLRNPLVTRELFMSSHGSDLVEMLGSLNALIGKPEFRYAKSDVAGLYYLNLRLLTLEMSRNLLQDLYLFCEPTKLKLFFAIPDDFAALTRRYHVAAINYVKIKFTVDRTISPVLKEFASFMKQAEAQSLTYSQLNNPKAVKVLNEYGESVLSDDLINYSNILQLLEQISGTQTGAVSREVLKSQLAEANSLSRQLRYQFKLMFRYIGQSLNQPVTTGNMEGSIQKLEGLNRQILGLIQKDLIWFENRGDSPAESKFTEDLYSINNKVMLPLAQYIQARANTDLPLAEALMQANPNFQPIFDLGVIKTLNNKVNQCLSAARD